MIAPQREHRAAESASPNSAVSASSSSSALSAPAARSLIWPCCTSCCGSLHGHRGTLPRRWPFWFRSSTATTGTAAGHSKKPRPKLLHTQFTQFVLVNLVGLALDWLVIYLISVPLEHRIAPASSGLAPRQDRARRRPRCPTCRHRRHCLLELLRQPLLDVQALTPCVSHRG